MLFLSSSVITDIFKVLIYSVLSSDNENQGNPKCVYALFYESVLI